MRMEACSECLRRDASMSVLACSDSALCTTMVSRGTCGSGAGLAPPSPLPTRISSASMSTPHMAALPPCPRLPVLPLEPVSACALAFFCDDVRPEAPELPPRAARLEMSLCGDRLRQPCGIAAGGADGCCSVSLLA